MDDDGLTGPMQDLSIGRGDNAPALAWSLPFAPAGSAFELAVSAPSHGIAWIIRTDDVDATLTATSATGGTGLVVWAIAPEQSQALPLGRIATYTLRRDMAGGERRFYAAGFLIAVDGPVDPTLAQVVVAGPQGVSGAALVLTRPLTAVSSVAVSHSFAYRPRAWLVDQSGAEVETDVVHASASQVVVTFPAPFTGTLYLA